MSTRPTRRGPVTIHLVIEKLIPLTGTASAESGETLHFEGWLGLLGALSELLGAGRPVDRREDP